MPDSPGRHSIDLLLASIYLDRGEDGLEQKFFFGKPGAPHYMRRIGAHIFFRRALLIRAALYVRQNGPSHLKFMAVRDIESLLRNFTSENFAYLFDETQFERFACSFGDRISHRTKDKLGDVLAASTIFKPSLEVTLYPLVPIAVESDFDSECFFLIQPHSLDLDRLSQASGNGLTPEEFPPVASWNGRKERPGSWLGVRSPIIQASNKIKSAILGAVALTPHRHYRHQFSGRTTFGGSWSINADGVAAMFFGDSHTPPMSQDIVIKERDHPWLTILASKLGASDNDTRRQIRALEYFYRAWPLDESERFPLLFMALDAIFGDAGRATQAVIEAIQKLGESAFDYDRLKLLLNLRGSVIHGGAPDVYDSEKYHRYFETYSEDPIFDLEQITAAALRSTIFGNALAEHPDPHADLIRAYHDGTLQRRKA
jgi:hypothetical protein